MVGHIAWLYAFILFEMLFPSIPWDSTDATDNEQKKRESQTHQKHFSFVTFSLSLSFSLSVETEREFNYIVASFCYWGRDILCFPLPKV